MLGFAWQKGWIPLAYETLVRAIELNGVAIDANKRAFEWGRAAAHDAEAVRKAAFPAQVIELRVGIGQFRLEISDLKLGGVGQRLIV